MLSRGFAMVQSGFNVLRTEETRPRSRYKYITLCYTEKQARCTSSVLALWRPRADDRREPDAWVWIEECDYRTASLARAFRPCRRPSIAHDEAMKGLPLISQSLRPESLG